VWPLLPADAADELDRVCKDTEECGRVAVAKIAELLEE
jgi:hypothetical protein